MARPIVFVSSTVHDLRDTRSAIKYWLEEWGFEVRLNEYRDFPDVLDKNSYQACLDAVSSADYCITLIGNRVGGWYSKEEGISITRQEYKVAYEHFRRTGKPRLLPLVRGEVWDAYGMCRRTQGGGLPVPWPYSPTIDRDDAEAIFPFIDEVRRLDDMKEAAAAGSERPTANWVHVFRGFEDVATAVKTQLGVTRSLHRQALIANLVWELEGNMRLLAFREGLVVLNAQLGQCLSDLDYSPSQLQESVVLPPDQESALRLYLAMTRLPLGLGTQSLNAAIDGGEFLEYSASASEAKVGLLQQCLIRLRDVAAILEADAHRRTLEETMREYVFAGSPGARIPVMRLLLLTALWQAHWNVTALTMHLLRFFYTNDANCLEEIPMVRGPFFKEQRPNIEKENLTREQIREWLQSCGATGAL